LRYARSVASLDKPAADHLGLDLGCALEDVEYARIAEHAADRIFHRITIAAVDLQRVVGIRPGDSRGEQLGHSGLDIAAAVAVLLARGEVGALPRHHRFAGHPGELAGNPRKRDDRLAELNAIAGIAQAKLHGTL